MRNAISFPMKFDPKKRPFKVWNKAVNNSVLVSPRNVNAGFYEQRLMSAYVFHILMSIAFDKNVFRKRLFFWVCSQYYMVTFQ